MKIAYFGYDLFYPCLEKILTCDNITVLKVFSFPENSDDKHEKIKYLSRKHNIEFTQEKITKKDIDELIEKGVDLLVCAGYAYKIPITEKVTGINLHPALLPQGRGGWPMPVTILKGLKKTGLTVHVLTANFDDGNILKQKEYILEEKENLESLNLWFTNNCADLVYECVINFGELLEKSKPQGNGEYWDMPNKTDMTFSKSTNVSDADKITRAFYGSGCFYANDGCEIAIKKAHIEYGNSLTTSKNEFLLNGGKLIVEEFN